MRPRAPTADSDSEDAGGRDEDASPGPSPVQLLWLVSIFGYIYWGLYALFYFNFISYLLLIGPILVVPAIWISYSTNPPSSARSVLLTRRVCLAGWLLAIMMLLAFSNVAILPEQIGRHLDKSNATITPYEPLVLQLRDKFYDDVGGKAKYDAMPFAKRMWTVDDFIYRTITWKDDLEQYGVLGLLTTPKEVLTRMAGDCQGQSAVTASLLFALGGVQAYSTETPFHWWTWASDLETGEMYVLNAHGSAALDGSVLPQPVDLSYTWHAPRCQVGVDANCTDVTAHNRETLYYMAPPHRALAIAFTGTHEFRRDIVPKIPFGSLPIVGLLVAVVWAIYATLFQCDFCAMLATSAGGWRAVKRAVAAAPACLVGVYGFWGWAYIWYPGLLVQLVVLASYALSYVSGDTFNKLIGTPPPNTVARAQMSCGCARLRQRRAARNLQLPGRAARGRYSAVATTASSATGSTAMYRGRPARTEVDLL